MNNFAFPLLQSQLDIPFKVKAGHIGEIVVICSCLLYLQKSFSYCSPFDRTTGAKDPVEEPLHTISRGDIGWCLSPYSPISK